MKFLKKSQLNFRNVKDNSVAVQISNEITLDSPNAVRVPRGTITQRPGGVDSINPTSLGQLRYNTTSNELEVYQGAGGRAAWRSLRYKESTQIVQQDLGTGDDEEYIFGPLNPVPPTTDLVDDKSTWSGANLLVFVENVMQLHTTNYVILQNPCRVTDTVISFVNVASPLSNKIRSANTATVNWVDRGFRIGQTITVTGSNSNSGTYTITNVTASDITVSQTVANESAGVAITVLGLSSATTGQTFAGAAYPTGYYLQFQGPVPLGTVDPKHVTVLHGFDR
jgi:uncharacterized repeat protein (TIGR01451 family)